MIIPFGLLHHKTRKIAAIILLLFHTYLALSVFADFSSLALFLLVGCLIDFDAKPQNDSLLKYLRFYMLFVLLSILSVLILNYFNTNSYYSISFYKGAVFVVGYLCFGLYFIVNNPSKRDFFKSSFLGFLIPLVVFLFFYTMRTYIGLGNTGNFTMFSNLVTEKSRNNHFLIDTRKTKIIDLEEDYVEIIAFENKYYADKVKGKLLPLSEFQYRISYSEKYHDEKIPAELIYKNKYYKIADLRKSPFNNSKWWYRWILFRPIQKEGCNKCRW